MVLVHKHYSKMWNFGFAQYLTSTLHKNKRAYAALSLEPKENAYFCPEELVSTLMDTSIRVAALKDTITL